MLYLPNMSDILEDNMRKIRILTEMDVNLQ
jgi:hypothetical protein